MMNYDWAINGRPYPDQPLATIAGQQRHTDVQQPPTMWHPMHLHGHTFQVIRPDGSPGRARTPHRHAHAARGRPHRRQPWHLDVALPQRVPHGAGMMTSLNYVS